MEERSIGRYRLAEKLGAGAGGRVFRAVGVDDNALVAIKLSRSTTEPHDRLFAREIELLARIAGKSRGLVSLLEHGQRATSSRWYAMEYLPGGSLSDLIGLRQAPSTAEGAAFHTHPSTSKWQAGDVSELAFAIAKNLGTIHEHGIVHGDLTPGNILLRTDGSPVIIDFGSAVDYGGLGNGRETTLDGLPACATPGYAAPELRLGAPSSFRTDLYSFGCLWTALLFGFPLPLSALAKVAEGLPEAHTRLLQWLLEPNPERRCPDVERAIECWDKPAPSSRSLRRRSIAPWRAHFVGRDAQLSALADRLHQAHVGCGSTLIISGESGIGKTRFLNEFIASASQRGARVYAASCPPPLAEDSDHAAVLLPLRVWLTECLATTAPGEHLDLRAALAVGSPIPAEVVGGENPSDDLRRARVLDSILALMHSAEDVRPLVLVVDDLQWADPMTVAVFRAKRFQEISTLPILLIGAVRSERLNRETYPVDSMRLDRLGMSSVYELLKGLLGTRQLPSGLVDWLLVRTDGNPLFLTEFSRHLLSVGALHPGEPGEWHFQPEQAGNMPASLQEVVDSRLGSLSKNARCLVRAAAELGSEFALKDAMHLTTMLWAMDEPAARAAAEELLTAHVLVLTEERVTFSHVLFRERATIVGRELEGPAFSSRMATYLSQAGATQLDEIGLARLAHLWSSAGDLEKAFGFIVQAVSVGRCRPGARLRELCELAISLSRSLPDKDIMGPERAALHLTLGDLLHREARFLEAAKQYQTALALALPSAKVTRAKLWRKLARSLMTGHRYDEAELALGRANQELGPGTMAPGEALEEWIEVQQGWFWLTYYRGTEPRDLLERLRPIVEAQGSLLQKSHFYQCASAALTARDGFRCSDESLSYARLALEQIESAENLADRRALSLLMVGFPLVWSNGNFETGIDMLERSVALATWLDDVPVLARATTYLTVGFRRHGRADRVREMAAEALRYAEQAGSSAFKGAALANQAWVKWREGDLDAARPLCIEARQHWKEGTLRYPFQCLLNLVWADILRLDEHFDSAARLLRELLAPDLHRLPEPLAQAIHDLPPDATQAANVLDRNLLKAISIAARHFYL